MNRGSPEDTTPNAHARRLQLSAVSFGPIRKSPQAATRVYGHRIRAECCAPRLPWQGRGSQTPYDLVVLLVSVSPKRAKEAPLPSPVTARLHNTVYCVGDESSGAAVHEPGPRMEEDVDYAVPEPRLGKADGDTDECCSECKSTRPQTGSSLSPHA